MSADVVVIGAGGFGRETLDVIEAHNEFFHNQGNEGRLLRVIGVVDDLPTKGNLGLLEQRQYRYLGTTERVLSEFDPCGFVLAIGDPRIRRKIDRKFVQASWHAKTVIHPAATIGTMSVLDEGNIVCAGAQISTNTRLGRHVHVNPNATIGHDTILEDFVSVNPGAVISGEVFVGSESLVGAASVILQGLKIGNSSTIGASACVIDDVEIDATVIGIPARPMEAQRKPALKNHSNQAQKINNVNQ